MADYKLPKTFRPMLWALLVIPAFAAAVSLARAAEPAVTIPAPALDEPAATGAAPQTIVLAGGCFWGVQAVFEHTKGVTKAVSGYAGGKKDTAHYEMVGTGRTGHAESVSGHVRSAADFVRQDLADLLLGRA